MDKWTDGSIVPMCVFLISNWPQTHTHTHIHARERSKRSNIFIIINLPSNEVTICGSVGVQIVGKGISCVLHKIPIKFQFFIVECVSLEMLNYMHSLWWFQDAMSTSFTSHMWKSSLYMEDAFPFTIEQQAQQPQQKYVNTKTAFRYF